MILNHSYCLQIKTGTRSIWLDVPADAIDNADNPCIELAKAVYFEWPELRTAYWRVGDVERFCDYDRITPIQDVFPNQLDETDIDFSHLDLV